MRQPRPIRIEGDVAYVPLTKGYEAVIDAADVPLVEGRLWRVMEIRRKDGTIKAIYAGASGPAGRGTSYMHRDILGAVAGVFGDHRDGNGLNNRRQNLRTATPAENAQNRRIHRNNTSGIKGVAWSKSIKKWQAYIMAGGMSVHLGVFDNIGDAAEAYAKASAAFHGDFGRVA